MPVNHAQLATEINTDPRGLGYAPHVASGSDGAIAALLNTVGASGETIFKAYVDTEDVIAGIVRSEYDSLVAAGKTYLNEVVLKARRVKTGDATLRTQIAALFPAGTATRTNLTNISSRSATRGEVLFGEGTQVTDGDVAQALRG